MKYDNIVKGTFIHRENRFIAYCEINGKNELVHVKNTGRLKELLIPYATVYLQKNDKLNRKTKYDLISVIKKTNRGDILVNIDSQIANDVAYEWIKSCGMFSNDAEIIREYTVTHEGTKSRFDIFVKDEDRRAFIEVKGVTLENDGFASFPDAPTLRGIKHLNHLSLLKREGYEAYVLFVIQMKGVYSFTPNRKTHLAFCESLKNAEKCGVKILCYDCVVDIDSIGIDKPVKYFFS
ncbi:MAG: DNA/RNA nuclease SfsA [Clostridia bacterium]|nr:DNA/RNA nuclease SfsA [Clostridia bacterium]